MELDFQKERRTILVCGAGISGLASALFIARAGYRVEIYEQATNLNTVGSGLQLSPNAMHVLKTLGLERQIKSASTAPPCIEIHSATSGKNVTEIPLGTNITQKYKQPYLVIHRADLQKILYIACQNEPDISIKLGTMVQDAVAHPNGISIIADNAEGTQNYRGVALIGADGVNSVIRKECFATSKIKTSGTFALRALINNAYMPEHLKSNNISMWLAPNAHAVIYPLRAHNYQNVVLTVRNDFGIKAAKSEISSYSSDDEANISRDKIAQGLNNWHPNFTQLLNIDTQWTKWPISVVGKLQKWQEGRFVLVGDAAHAMTPHAAQGAAMALEDAAVLGWAISSGNQLEDAFILYQKERDIRINSVRRLSQKNKNLFQMPQYMSYMRNFVLWASGNIGAKRILARQDWIYNWRAPISQPEMLTLSSLNNGSTPRS